MRSLFLRVFLAFWAATALVVVLLIASSPYFTRDRPRFDRVHREAAARLEARVEEAASRVAAGHGMHGRGEGAFRRGPDRGAFGPFGAILLLAPDGSPVAGPAPAADEARFARRVATGGEPLTERNGATHMAGRPVRAPDGRPLVVVSSLRLPPRLVELIEPGALARRLLLLVAVVALPCWWIARQLAAPVAALQGAVRGIAAGDLSARVPAGVEARRDEVGALARDFNAMAARVGALVGAQSRLVRDVSHELRSPLARLRVALELARRNAAPESAAALDRIELETQRLDEMVGEILALSRLDAAEAPARREPVDLVELAESVAADARFEAGARGVTVAVEAEPDPPAVPGDVEALRSALENVVRNAVAHTADGTTVRVGVARRGEGVEVSVADAGPGVPESALGALFAPFFRVDPARGRGADRGGAGLGLAIAARAVRLHGGDVSARNRPAGGLEIVLRLPA